MMRIAMPSFTRRNRKAFEVVATVIFILAALGTCLGRESSARMREEIVKMETDFGQAVIKNDADAVGQFLTDDWIIIDPDGGVIDKTHFLDVIRSGALAHEQMDSDEVRIRIYGDTAIATTLTRTKGKFMGQDFTTQERATDVLVKKDGRWQIAFSQLTRFSKK
jgi:ketosteroid isomerase-like protein